MAPTFTTQLLSINPKDIQFQNSGSITDIFNGNPVYVTDKASEVIETSVKLLSEDHVIGMPTETVYGLAANALNENATDKIFSTKGRPSDNPLIVHISSLHMLASLLQGKEKSSTQKSFSQRDVLDIIPKAYHEVIEKFWPGPLTLLFPTSDLIPSAVTAGQPTVAIRFPSHPVTRALINACGFPLAAPSANLSGRPSPTHAQHVLSDLNGKIKLIVDAGACDSGVESTVLDALRCPPVILRPGGVTYEMLTSTLPELAIYKKDFVDKKLEEAPTTPGMKYKHYTPNAHVIVVESNDPHEWSSLLSNQKFSNQDSIGIMGTQNFISTVSREVFESSEPSFYIKEIHQEDLDVSRQSISPASIGKYDRHHNNSKCVLYSWSLGDQPQLDPQVFARDLFHGLRSFEKNKTSHIIVQGVHEDHEGLAVMNRLRKAASVILS